jgi:hypothetical protein
MQETRLRLGEVGGLDRGDLLQELAGLDDVGFDLLGRGVEGVRLTLPEVIDQVNELVWLQFSGYRTTLAAAPPSGSGRLLPA